MGKKIHEKHTISIKGVLELVGDKITLEVEDLGSKNLSQVISKFDGQNVSLTISYEDEIE